MADTPLMSLTFALPFPPSVNTMWRHVVLGKRSATLLSKKGREYRVAVFEAVCVDKVPRGALKGRLSVQAIAYPPDRRARDLDNLWKGCLDALTHAGVIGDDADIDELTIRRGPVRAEGLLEMRVSEIAREPEQAGFGFGHGVCKPGTIPVVFGGVAEPPPF
jgi:crossover junction endodeoxyribonuclease RusA